LTHQSSGTPRGEEKEGRALRCWFPYVFGSRLTRILFFASRLAAISRKWPFRPRRRIYRGLPLLLRHERITGMIDGQERNSAQKWRWPKEYAEAYLEASRIAERAAVAEADMWEMGEKINRWEANYPGALRTLHYLRNKMKKRTSSRMHHLDGCSNKFSTFVCDMTHSYVTRLERFKAAPPRAVQKRRHNGKRWPAAHDRRWLAAHGTPPNGDGRP
jgi:hypothetical protein